jgi:phosphatidylglycerol:prolipoprotein diacylglycerol transferase
MAFAAPPGLLLGRLANFINGELLGKIVALPGQPAPWWAVKFPQEVTSGHDAPRAPEQLIQLQSFVGQRLGTREFEVAYARLIDKLQNGNREVAAKLEPLISARHPSQLYQALAEGVVLGLALLLIWRNPRKPGVISAWFLVIYGLLRIATEFWRLPDAHLAVPRLLGLSYGQWLSALMVAIGLALLAVVSRSASAPLGGWGVRTPGTDPIPKISP